MKNQPMRTESHKKTQETIKHLSKTGDTTDTSWRTLGMSEITKIIQMNMVTLRKTTYVPMESFPLEISNG